MDLDYLNSFKYDCNTYWICIRYRFVRDSHQILQLMYQTYQHVRLINSITDMCKICFDTSSYGFRPVSICFTSVLVHFRFIFSRILIGYRMPHTQPHRRCHKISHKFIINLSNLKTGVRFHSSSNTYPC
jgi:hypothetical protein